MAAAFGVTPGTISNWENDVNQPRNLLTVVVPKWAKLTNVDASWLLDMST
jgi:transcriptional regulator with XRE-family HTH domain